MPSMIEFREPETDHFVVLVDLIIFNPFSDTGQLLGLRKYPRTAVVRLRWVLL